jgi:alpha-amylase/alpha-mannosidase (GH57 family)
MHQPQYRHAVESRYLKPWTWLHGIKDYADMAAHLESVPGAKAVVNFSSILLVQLEDYCARIARWRIEGLPIGDPLLDALGGGLPGTTAEQLAVTEACLHANEAHMIAAFPPFSELHGEAREAVARSRPLDADTFYDFVTWYHLAWTGESLRREHPLLRTLMQKARDFGRDDRWDAEAIEADVLASQRSRRVVDAALRRGRYQPWDWQPVGQAAELYMRNHLDLNEVEASRRSH